MTFLQKVSVILLQVHAIPLRSSWVMTCAYAPSGSFVACGGRYFQECFAGGLLNTNWHYWTCREKSVCFFM